MRNVFVVMMVSLLFAGCLQTRNEVRENEQRHVMQQQVTTLQRSNADVGNRFSDLEEQMRELNGRVDVVENRLGQSQAGLERELKNNQVQGADINQKLVILQEALTKMEGQMFQLTAEVQGLKEKAAAMAAAQAADKGPKPAKKDSYESAQDFFNKKDWKQAILNYQKYRDESPKGKNFADATYKIGVSFQELGMKDEAKTFFDEVVGKFPKSEEARRAKVRLKGLKK